MHTALVTGGSSGIGAEICRQMLEAGYRVVSLALEMPDVSHPHLYAYRVDLMDEATTAEIAAEMAGQFGISHFVHAAGVIRPALLAEVRQDDLVALTRLHLGAPLLLAQALLPGMRNAGFGRIVLVSSRALLGAQTRSAYAATKAGLLGLARTWALELAGAGITVNVVAPGPIGGTRMFHEVVPEGSAQEARLAAAIPVGRLGRPIDVARAVLFFADPANDFVTGQTLFVCGGASIGSVTI